MDRFPGRSLADDRREAAIETAEVDAAAQLIEPALRTLSMIWLVSYVCETGGDASAFDDLRSSLHDKAADFIGALACELEERGCSRHFIDRFEAEARHRAGLALTESSRRAFVAASAQAGDGHCAFSRSPAGGPSKPATEPTP